MKSHKPFTKLDLFVSYLKDWLLVIVFLGIFFFVDSLQPYNRRFSLNDPTIQFPYTEKETVPLWALGLIIFVAPVVIMTAIALGVKRSFLDWHNACLGLLLSIALTEMVTATIKVTVGRPRPDFIDRCKPQAGANDSTPFGLSTSSICTWTDDAIMKDAYKSLPSGHASTAFAGMTFLSLYLAGKLHVFDTGGHTYKSFVTTAPYIVATLVAISRTTDYRHHWQDVLVGGLLGSTFAAFAYLQYYPPPWFRKSHVPYNHRLYSGPLEEFGTDNGDNSDIAVTGSKLLPSEDNV